MLEHSKNWKVATATQIGIAHQDDEQPICQDKVLEFRFNNYTFLGLSDGMGSSKYSQIGAENILKFVCGHLMMYFDKYMSLSRKQTKRHISKEIKKAISFISKDKNIAIHDLSSTLLVVAMKNERFFSLHIGDGVMGYTKKDSINVLSHPQIGEFHNETFFTTNLDKHKRIVIKKGKTNKIDGFILMSDGLDNSFYDYKDKSLVALNKDVINWLKDEKEEEISKILKSHLKTTFSKRSFDDMSIVIARKENKNDSV